MPCQHAPSDIYGFDAKDYISGEIFKIKKCKKCNLIYTAIESSEFSAQEYYSDDYYRKNERYSYIFSVINSYLIRRRVSKLDVYSKKAGYALDIGCGQGYFLKELSDNGWDCTGIEVSERSAYFAKKNLGLKVLTENDSLKNLESDSFDVICLWHVLEHIEEFESTLKEAQRVLSQDGELLLSVPNIGSWEAKYGKGDWFHLDVPRHVVHFSEETLNAFLKSAGLKIKRKSYFTPEYDFFSFIQTVQNKMGIEMNLLYRMLRKGTISNMKKSKWQKFQKIVTLLTLPWIALLSLVLVPVAILSNQGSTIVLVVGKNDKQ